MPILSAEKAQSIPPDVRVLELGSAKERRVPHSVTLDINPRSGADVLHDLNIFPYPFRDNEFDIIIAEHVIEHLDNVMRVMEELHRITKPGGRIYVQVPHFSSADYFTDITHRHSFSTRSFDYFVPGEWLARFEYSTVQFKKIDARIMFRSERWIGKALTAFANANKHRYERRFAFILPADWLDFELEVQKPAA